MCLNYCNVRYLWFILEEMNFKVKFAKYIDIYIKKSFMNRDLEEKKD